MIFAVPRREYRRTDPTHVRSIMSDYGPNRRFWRRFRGFMGAISTFLNHSSILKNTIPFVHRSLLMSKGSACQPVQFPLISKWLEEARGIFGTAPLVAGMAN